MAEAEKRIKVHTWFGICACAAVARLRTEGKQNLYAGEERRLARFLARSPVIQTCRGIREVDGEA